MKQTKKSLLVSAASILLSAALLAGSTFAWFTDSVTNIGNTIEAGKLDINVIGYRLEDGNWGKVAWENDLKSNPLFTEKTWEPGQYGAILLRVSNYDSTLAAKVDIDFTIKDSTNNLEDALWYRLKAVQTTDASHQNAMLEELQFKNSRPSSEADGVTTMSKIEEDPTDPVTIYSDYHDGQYVYYLLEYGMYTSAGNQYQNGSIEVDFSVKATQATVEKDGFGNSNYDKDAPFPDIFVTTDYDTPQQAIDAAEKGDTVILNDNQVLTSPLIISEGITLDLGTNTIANNTQGKNGIHISGSDNDITIKATTGGVNMVNDRCIYMQAKNSNVVVDGGVYSVEGTSNAYFMEDNWSNSGSNTVTIQNVTYTGDRGVQFSNSDNNTILIKDSTFTTTGYSGLFIGGNNNVCTLENVTFEGSRLMAADSSHTGTDGYSVIYIKSGVYKCPLSTSTGCTISITGGTFSSNPTKYLAEGYTATKGDDNMWVVTAE